MSRFVQALIGFTLLALLVLLILIKVAATDEQPHQPRTLGQRAALILYYYAPATLEITYVDRYLFKDVDACVAAIPKALLIAEPYASEGDLVEASCVAVHPPEHKAEPPHTSTEL